MSDHVMQAVDPYDGGTTVCRGCGARGTFTESPTDDCPAPYKSASQSLTEAIEERNTLRAEVDDLKARLLEAERGNEELVRLRAEMRDLRALIAECDEYLNTNNLTSICHGSILHRKMIDAAMATKEG